MLYYISVYFTIFLFGNTYFPPQMAPVRIYIHLRQKAHRHHPPLNRHQHKWLQPPPSRLHVQAVLKLRTFSRPQSRYVKEANERSHDSSSNSFKHLHTYTLTYVHSCIPLYNAFVFVYKLSERVTKMQGGQSKHTQAHN